MRRGGADQVAMHGMDHFIKLCSIIVHVLVIYIQSKELLRYCIWNPADLGEMACAGASVPDVWTSEMRLRYV